MKRNLALVFASLCVMVGLPLLTVTFASHDAGMMICFLLFFAIDPLYTAIVGILSGQQIRQAWFQPLVTSLLFLVGTWLFFDERETAFFGYAGVYLLLGLAAMGITILIDTIKK